MYGKWLGIIVLRFRSGNYCLTACIAIILEESFNYHLEGVSVFDHVVLVIGAISVNIKSRLSCRLQVQ